jgi:hypothetical protein
MARDRDARERCEPMTTPRRYDTVSFLTDYGNRDEFVGVV